MRIGIEFERGPDDRAKALGFTTPYRDTIWFEDASGPIEELQAEVDRQADERYEAWITELTSRSTPEPDATDATDATDAVASALEAVDTAQAALTQARAALNESTAPPGEAPAG